jgi:ribosomal protein S1
MKSLKHGKDISISVENITPFGIWVYIKGKEYFLSYEDYPYFKEQTLKAIQNVQLLHGYHLYWPVLDIDLEINNLEHPEKYPLKSKIAKNQSTSHATGRQIAAR